MTVKELIAFLQDKDPEGLVLAYTPAGPIETVAVQMQHEQVSGPIAILILPEELLSKFQRTK